MGSLSMPASDSHTKYHWPPERSSDLLCADGLELQELEFSESPVNLRYQSLEGLRVIAPRPNQQDRDGKTGKVLLILNVGVNRE
jgi:hypothetical protein